MCWHSSPGTVHVIPEAQLCQFYTLLVCSLHPIPTAGLKIAKTPMRLQKTRSHGRDGYVVQLDLDCDIDAMYQQAMLVCDEASPAPSPLSSPLPSLTPSPTVSRPGSPTPSTTTHPPTSSSASASADSQTYDLASRSLDADAVVRSLQDAAVTYIADPAVAALCSSGSAISGSQRSGCRKRDNRRNKERRKRKREACRGQDAARPQPYIHTRRAGG
ncbi:hypothetical protein FISHEDRAFT_59079 [Fistulina hepatica ATCC 64428]|uniref:Uncharacterized protein n=1 Tax=Fistulina hepatica ATCC 64428 TaxID=1128425 RepID=A0A0D7ABP9_9AGAR|nr:hypothetical protein FISHEDRAFT_59079 [Fistulina hepatica ATCC 64428]